MHQNTSEIMRTLAQQLRIILPLVLFLFATPDANAQLLKKLGKAAERAAERTVERRVEKETREKTDAVLDSILEPGNKGKATTKDKTQSPWMVATILVVRVELTVIQLNP